MASADASANDSTPRRGVSIEERRRLRSLLCAAGSARLPGRIPGGGASCPRGAACASCATSSPTICAVLPLPPITAVMKGNHNGHPLVSQPQAEPSLPPVLGGSSASDIRHHPQGSTRTGNTGKKSRSSETPVVVVVVRRAGGGEGREGRRGGSGGVGREGGWFW